MGVFTGLGETAQKGAVGLHLRLVLHLLLGCGLQQSGLKASRHRYQWTQQLFTIRSRHGGFTGFAGEFVVRAQLILGQNNVNSSFMRTHFRSRALPPSADA